MSASNWAGDINPDQVNNYGANNLGFNLQIGLGLQGLPVQLLNFPVPSSTAGNSNRPRRDGQRRGNHHNNYQHKKPLEIEQTVDGIPIRKVYVTNIGFEIQRSDMFDIFNQFGKIVHIYLGIAKRDNLKKFAFVTFVDPLSAAWVLTVGKIKDALNRTMFIMAADSWHQPKEGPDGTILWDTRSKVQPIKHEDSDEDDEQEVEATENDQAVEEITKEEGLNVLNDYCLLRIFSFLSLKELIGVERVCKRWQGLSYRVWRCLHELNLSQPRHKGKQFSTPVLEQYLRRCGEALSLLDLSVSNHSFNETTIAVVAKYCANLQVLKVKNINIGKRALAHLGRRCPKLTQLSLELCHKFNDGDLMSLLAKCEALTQLELTQCSGVTGKSLSVLRGPVHTLHINYCASLDQNHLIQGLQRVSQTLRSLTVITCSLRSGEVEKLVSAAPDLTELCLSRTFCQAAPHTLTPVSRLVGLTRLDLTLNSAVNDKVLEAIALNCLHLAYINLSSSGGGCGSVLSEKGVSLLGHLKQLTELDLSYLEATNSMALKILTSRNSRLKRLVCRGCPELNDDGSCQVVTVCNDLELFDLSGCDNITNATVKAADTSCKMRTNSVSLRLIVGGTTVDQTELTEPFTPLLTVDLNDLCEETMRPDFIDDMFFPPSDSEDDDDLDHLCERIGCDCDFDYDDLYDPTLFPHDEKYDTLKFEDGDDTEVHDWGYHNDDEDDDDIDEFFVMS